jgi:hypothetical protein
MVLQDSTTFTREEREDRSQVLSSKVGLELHRHAEYALVSRPRGCNRSHLQVYGENATVTTMS